MKNAREQSACPVTANDSVSELSVCPVTSTEAAVNISVLFVPVMPDPLWWSPAPLCLRSFYDCFAACPDTCLFTDYSFVFAWILQFADTGPCLSDHCSKNTSLI